MLICTFRYDWTGGLYGLCFRWWPQFTSPIILVLSCVLREFWQLAIRSQKPTSAHTGCQTRLQFWAVPFGPKMASSNHVAEERWAQYHGSAYRVPSARGQSSILAQPVHSAYKNVRFPILGLPLRWRHDDVSAEVTAMVGPLWKSIMSPYVVY